MKIHLRSIRRSAHLTLAALTLAVAASVSAQTVITPDLKAPPGAYNTASPGMVLRAHQIAAARSPGDQNSIGNVLKELSGGFGPSLSAATSGPLTGGLWSEVYLNHTIEPAWPADGDGDWWYFTAPALPFPGINTDTNQTGGFSTFAYEVITYLNLPAGTNTLSVGSGDSFLLTIGAGDNPYSFSAVTSGQFSGGRNFGVSTFDIDVQSAGVYPVRLVYGQGGGTAGLQFFSWNADTRYLINDPDGAGMELTAYRPASLPITPSQAYVSLLAPVPGETGVSPQPTVRVELTDGASTTVDTNTIAISFDGGTVSPTITKTGKMTYVSYTVPSALAGLSTHTVQFVAWDSAAKVLSNQWTFTVGSFLVIPASYAYPAGSGDATQRGFAGRVHQTRDAANGSYTVLYGNAQIEGQLIDGATGLPYVNTVVTNGDPIINMGWPGTQPADAGGGPGDARTFTVTNVVNYSIADGVGGVMDTGNFNSVNGYPDALFPGLPGSNDDTFSNYSNSGEIAVELVAFVELSAGLHQIGVNCEDGFQLAISPNNARDIFRQELIKNETNRDAQDSVATLFVETNGVYSFRVIYRVYRDRVANSLEWFSLDPVNPAIHLLINDKVVGAVKSYRALTVATRPYVKSISPAQDASGVLPLAPISVVLANASNITPVLKVNGSTVGYTATTNGHEVTLTYTPAAALSGIVNCEVQYGGLTGKWSYVVRSGRQVLWITSGSTPSGGDTPLVNRLSTKYGLDVKVVGQSSLASDLANGLTLTTGKVLIVVSSAVSGGTVQPWARACISSDISVPVITWESANADDWAFTEGAQGATVGLTQIAISNGPVYLHAGFTNGQVVTTHTGSGGGMNCPAAPETIMAAYIAAGTGNPVLVGVEKGLVVNSSVFGSPVTHASRKVYFGLVNNDSAQNLSADGMKLWDATVEWLVPAPPAPPKLTATAGPGAGQMTLSWTSTGTLETTISLTPPASWANAPSQANPQTVPTTGTQRYYRVKQ